MSDPNRLGDKGPANVPGTEEEPLGGTSPHSEAPLTGGSGPSETPPVRADGAATPGPPGPVSTPTWAAPPPSRQPEVPGAPGYFFAATVTRVAALLIDSILVGLIGGVTGGLIGGVIGGITAATSPQGTVPTESVELLAGLVGVPISLLYFTLLWRSTGKGTVGQRVFRMQVGNAFDGAILTWSQALVRWLVLFGFGVLAILPVIGVLGGVVGFAWELLLFFTTALSATKQGLHDRWANSAVVATGPQNTTLAWGCLVTYVIGFAILFVVLVGLLAASAVPGA